MPVCASEVLCGKLFTMAPQTLSTQTIYTGRIFDVRLDTVSENHIEYTREIVVHKGSAVIVPLFEDGTVMLVRQYRHAAGEYMLEVPAGSLESEEDPATCARRELEEEVGLRAEKLEKLTEFYVSPGFVTEKMHLFLATGLDHVGQKLEADELIDVERLSLPEIRSMIADGRICDAKTIIGVLLLSSGI